MHMAHLLKETFKGRTLGRAIQNDRLARVRLEGDGIDLGAGPEPGSYYEFLQIAPASRIALADLDPRGGNVARIDLEQPLPLPSGSKDFIIVNNVLHLVFNTPACLGECRRVLREGGRILGVIPFFHPVNPDPCDQCRYSRASLTRILAEAGFQDIQVAPLGFGAFSACANAMATLLRVRALKFLAYGLAIGLDKLVAAGASLLWGRGSGRGAAWSAETFPIYYFFECKK